MDLRLRLADDALERWENDFGHWVVDEASRVLVADQEGVLVGFVTAGLWRPPPIYASIEEVYINELYVTPTARGQGIGRGLVEAVRAWAEAWPVQRLRIGVLAANAGGQAFWRRLEAQPFSVAFTIDLGAPDGPEPAPKKARLGF